MSTRRKRGGRGGGCPPAHESCEYLKKDLTKNQTLKKSCNVFGMHSRKKLTPSKDSIKKKILFPQGERSKTVLTPSGGSIQKGDYSLDESIHFGDYSLGESIQKGDYSLEESIHFGDYSLGESIQKGDYSLEESIHFGAKR